MAGSAGAAHLTRLGASPRPTGGSAVAAARSYCASALVGLGCSIREHPFTYSHFAGGWAAPAIGFLLPAIATAYQRRAVALGALLLVALAAVCVGANAVLRFPLLRARGVNLEATRGLDDPRVWLVAHLDSKWQPVSMLVRVAGVILLAAGLVALVLAALLRPSVEGAAVAIAWVGGVPLMLSIVGAKNHGTLDNASGVATVLEAAALLPASLSFGVLITDAEEWALAGARAWGRSRPPGIALNCDSVDDEGPLVVMYSGATPSRVIAGLSDAASRNGERLRVLRLIPGILTDSVALAGAGWETLTLSRGTIRTLQRIHTRRDTLRNMRGTGISGAAQVLARAAIELAKEGAS